MRHTRELDPWGHLSIGPDSDTEVEVVSVEVDRTWQCSDTAEVDLEDAVGEGWCLGFGPDGRTTTRYGVDAEDDAVGTIGDIGAIGIDEFTLEVYLAVDAGGGRGALRCARARIGIYRAEDKSEDEESGHDKYPADDTTEGMSKQYQYLVGFGFEHCAFLLKGFAIGFERFGRREDFVLRFVFKSYAPIISDGMGVGQGGNVFNKYILVISFLRT